jgi:hypothetical protein
MMVPLFPLLALHSKPSRTATGLSRSYVSISFLQEALVSLVIKTHPAGLPSSDEVVTAALLPRSTSQDAECDLLVRLDASIVTRM